MSPYRKSYFLMLVVFFVSVTTVCVVADQNERLANLRKTYQLKESEEPEALLQGLILTAGQQVGEFVVLGFAYEPFQGVVYRFTQESEEKAIITGTIRLYRTHREAINDTLLKHGSGYSERPKRGSHQGKKDIGDFSLATTGTLTFVRRNVAVSLVEIDADVKKLDQLANEISAEIDKAASTKGKQKVVLPEVNLKFDRVQEEDIQKTVVSLSVPNDLEFSWKVIPSEGKVQVLDRQAVVKIRKGQPSPEIKVSVATRNGFVFERSHKD